MAHNKSSKPIFYVGHELEEFISHSESLVNGPTSGMASSPHDHGHGKSSMAIVPVEPTSPSMAKMASTNTIEEEVAPTYQIEEEVALTPGTGSSCSSCSGTPSAPQEEIDGRKLADFYPNGIVMEAINSSSISSRKRSFRSAEIAIRENNEDTMFESSDDPELEHLRTVGVQQISMAIKANLEIISDMFRDDHEDQFRSETDDQSETDGVNSKVKRTFCLSFNYLRDLDVESANMDKLVIIESKKDSYSKPSGESFEDRLKNWNVILTVRDDGREEMFYLHGKWQLRSIVEVQKFILFNMCPVQALAQKRHVNFELKRRGRKKRTMDQNQNQNQALEIIGQDSNSDDQSQTPESIGQDLTSEDDTTNSDEEIKELKEIMVAYQQKALYKENKPCDSE